MISLTVFATASAMSVSSSRGGRYSTSTGYVLPETWITGALPKNFAKRSVSSVAELTITRSSGRRGKRRCRMPSKKSMFRLRSCASSTMIVSYARSIGSPCSSASRMPSVMNLIYESRLTLSLNRTL